MNKKLLIICLVAVALISVWFIQTPHFDPSTHLTEVTICPGPGLPPTLVWVAQDRGYFRENGLNVTLIPYPTGTIALQQVVNGSLDYTVANEYVISEQILNNKPLVIVGTISESDTFSLVGRRDHGINQIADLEGKKIGIPRPSLAEYLLYRLLILNGISPNNVTISNQPPDKVSAAIISGDLDAGVLFEPYIYQIRQELDDTITVWPANAGQHAYYSLVTTRKFQEDHAETTGRLLAALRESEQFTNTHPDAVKYIANKNANLEYQYINSTWRQYHFSLGLSQSLIRSMEDETRWRIRTNLTSIDNVPDFTSVVSSDNLFRVHPSAVTIIR
jgi:NitT/TauT family transport system substrate-binding protein